MRIVVATTNSLADQLVGGPSVACLIANAAGTSAAIKQIGEPDLDPVRRCRVGRGVCSGYDGLMDATWLLLSMFYSTVGLGMFMYGKKAVRFVPLLAGIALLVVPYFIGSALWMTVACVALMASPFLLPGLEL